ncbi:MAG: PD-(D/E)XK nuclease family protein [Verrucomicrobiota bacterium]
MYHATTLERFARCPMSARLSMLTRDNPALEVGSDETRRGKVLHEATHELIRHGEAAARKLMDALLAEHPMTVRAQVLPIWERILASPPEVPAGAAIEQKFMLVDFRANNAEIIGTPDYYWTKDGDLYILDLKSHARPGALGDPAEVEQLLTYAVLLADGPAKSAESIHLGIHYLAHSYTVWSTIDFLRIEEHRTRLLKQVAAMDRCHESGEWPAQVGSHCCYCEQRPGCEPYQSYISEVPQDAPATQEEAAAMMDRAMLLVHEADRLKEMSKLYVEQHGPVERDGKVLDFHRKVTSWLYPYEDTIITLGAQGYDAGEVLRRIAGDGFTASALKSFMAGRKNPVKAALEPTKVPAGYTSTFDWRSKKEVPE